MKQSNNDIDCFIFFPYLFRLSRLSIVNFIVFNNKNTTLIFFIPEVYDLMYKTMNAIEKKADSE
jgi:hypothetical protein